MERGSTSRAGRKPSEMPMRVLDFKRMSMTQLTTPQNKPSFGKFNIPKSQSVTSENRTSFFGARSSGASTSRNSSMSGLGGSDKVKDTRPLHDKSYVQQCIQQLHEFLTENSYPGPLSSKILQSPFTKDFENMFEFIYRQLDPTYVMPKQKVEEEVPAIFKALRYPFVLSKASMYSVGAPHTWPQVLGALIWLTELVTITRALGQTELLPSDFCENEDIEDGAQYNKILLDYNFETYSKFMQGADTFEDEEEMVLDKLKKLYNVDEATLASAEERHRDLRDEVDKLEKESQTDRLMSKRMEKVTMQTDLEKLQSYLSSLQTFEANLEMKHSELNDEFDSAVSHLESLKQVRDKLEVQLRDPKWTPADVERVNREKNELQQTISSLSKSLEDAEQHKWNEEITLAKSREKMELRMMEYNKLTRKLKLIPLSAENPCGRDFEIKPFDFSNSSLGPFNTQLPMILRKMISDVEEEKSRLTNFKLSLEESQEQVISNSLDKLNDVERLREQIQKVDERLDSDMQEIKREEEEWAAEIESMEKHYSLLQKKVNVGYVEAVQEMKAKEQEYHLVCQETNEERRTVANNLATVFTAAANYLELTEKNIEDFHNTMMRTFSKDAEEDEATIQMMQDMLKNFKAKANLVCSEFRSQYLK